MNPKITKIDYTYKKENSDLWVLKKEDIPVDLLKVKDEQIVYLAPGSFGGNHKHPRSEWFIGIGELIFHWIDGDGEKQSEEMNPNGQILLFEVPPFLPHAVENPSNDKFGVLFELADAESSNVEEFPVI